MNGFANTQKSFNNNLELRNVLCIGGVHVAASTENENEQAASLHRTKNKNNPSKKASYKCIPVLSNECITCYCTRAVYSYCSYLFI